MSAENRCMKSKVLKKKKITSREWQLYSLCAIPMLLVFIFSYLPIGGIVIAFKNYKYGSGIFGCEWVGFDNFKFFVTSSDFVKIIRNTLGLNFCFIVAGMAASLFVAIMLFEVKSRTKTKIYQTIMITPHFISWVVASYMLYGFLNPERGLLNQLLVNVFKMESISWYTEPKVWPAILTISSVWKCVGMDSVVYYAALMGIDTSLFEAAEVDGASKWKINTKIVLPSLIPLITILTILKIGNIFRADFGLFYQMPRNIGILYPTTDVIDTYIFRSMREIGDMGMSTAAGLLQSVVGFILVIVTNSIVKKIDSSMSLF